LEAVEDEAGAAQVNVVMGDGVHDLGDGGADAVAVFGSGEVLDAGAGGAGFGVGDGAAGGVVEVAELLCAEAWAAALAAGGKDVAAAAGTGVLLGLGLWVRLGFLGRHGGLPLPYLFA
jgi:hypothetical protein